MDSAEIFNFLPCIIIIKIYKIRHQTETAGQTARFWRSHILSIGNAPSSHCKSFFVSVTFPDERWPKWTFFKSFSSPTIYKAASKYQGFALNASDISHFSGKKKTLEKILGVNFSVKTKVPCFWFGKAKTKRNKLRQLQRCTCSIRGILRSRARGILDLGPTRELLISCVLGPKEKRFFRFWPQLLP